MPSKEDILKEKTFKEEGIETDRRVFYTLTSDEKLAGHRTAKLVASLVRLLKDRRTLTDTDIDELLFECIH